MAHRNKAGQVAGPTAVARGAENMFVRHFQIAFRFEADGRQGAMTRGTPEEKDVREFRIWGHGHNRKSAWPSLTQQASDDMFVITHTIV